MIPWRMSFSGIRDYRPEQIDLSGIDNHVIITGPNGSGKSTITYCMGAVLYSSKVDIEGLRSRNLLPEHPWKAQISLLFKNDGLIKIDAPNFIQFTVKIVQEPSQPVKKEFYISTGDEMDQWEDTVKYSSGDRYFNFSSYKQDLQYKYKIDPDAFYLIWYQQEVNQFAVMNPEERFRIFSEMHGIDQTQRDWEESIEKMKDTSETLKTAQINVKNKNLELSIKRTDMDRYIDNQKRLKSGAKQYIESLMRLEVLLKKDRERYEEMITRLADEIEESRGSHSLKVEEKKLVGDKLAALQIGYNQLENTYEGEQEILKNMEPKVQETKECIAQLEKELEDITNKKNLISRTEGQVKEERERLAKETSETSRQLTEVLEKSKQINASKNLLQGAIAELKFKIEEDERQYQTHKSRLNEYKSSHAVLETIKQLDENITADKDEQWNMTRYIQELRDELLLLGENRNLSQRQSESLKLFRSQKIKAYPLRELIELDEQALLRDERLFNAIKYTIFFQGKYAEAPNDLYHVPLMNIVPERSIEAVPELHLKIKEGMKEEELTHAMKAIWWVEQFFKNGPHKIHNGILHDEMGIRGSQEKERYILSKKALLARKQEVQGLLAKSEERLSELAHHILTDTKQIRELNSIVQLVKEAEAFMTTEYERNSRAKKLDEGNAYLVELESKLAKLEEEKNGLFLQKVQLETEEKVLVGEEAFYKELGKMKDKYDQLLTLRSQFKDLKEQVVGKKEKLHKLEDELDLLERKIKGTERSRNQLINELEDVVRDLNGKAKQVKNYQDDLYSTTQQLVGYIQELTDSKNIVPDIYTTVSTELTFAEIPSIGQLKQQRENGQVTFNNARMETGIDPAAPENYQAVKEEFERLDDEYKRTKILLEQDMKRAEDLKDKLETTINMRVTEIQQRFKSYMSHFQFEGDIDWDPYEDKRGRTHFKLYIKARKEGHRGTMEDVSTKARGGKVGKGVSGGEESLTSLLFALALLQNLNFKPGFIVLDEFDSALDESRKIKVFDLYVKELKRKLIILTPKSHEDNYLRRFSKALVVKHDPTIPLSKVVGIVKKD